MIKLRCGLKWRNSQVVDSNHWLLSIELTEPIQFSTCKIFPNYWVVRSRQILIQTRFCFHFPPPCLVNFRCVLCFQWFLDWSWALALSHIPVLSRSEVIKLKLNSMPRFSILIGQLGAHIILIFIQFWSNTIRLIRDGPYLFGEVLNIQRERENRKCQAKAN